MLLGTYQSPNAPSDAEFNYNKYIIKLPKDGQKCMKGEKQGYLCWYYSLKFDGIKAKERMKFWWNKDKGSMLKSYLIEKPKILFIGIFYDIPVLKVNIKLLQIIRMFELIIFLMSCIIIFLARKYISETLFILFQLLFQVAIYCYTFAYSRYAISLCFYRYIIIGIGLSILYEYFKHDSDKKICKGCNDDKMNKKDLKTLVIIPAYNESQNITSTVNDLNKSIKKSKYKIDYVIINDGSIDNTRDICLKNNFNLIDLPFNLGIGGAVQTGYKYAFYNNYDIAIQFDADGQHDPKYIDSLIKEIEKGNNLVIGSRFVGDLSIFKSSIMRRAGIKILSSLIYVLTRKKIYDITSGFRACDRNIIEMFVKNYPTEYPEPETNAKIIKLNYSFTEIPVKMYERKAGSSSIKPIKSIYYMFSVSLAIVISILFKEGKK